MILIPNMLKPLWACLSVGIRREEPNTFIHTTTQGSRKAQIKRKWDSNSRTTWEENFPRLHAGPQILTEVRDADVGIENLEIVCLYVWF